MDDTPRTELRRGWTTGACAAGAARSAYQALLTGVFPDPVTVDLPKGLSPAFALARKSLDLDAGRAEASVVKDAGDDPDVTHGAEIVARVDAAEPGTGVVFHAGPGVGTVTLPGLPLAVGEPAINPAPRAIITRNLEAVAALHGGRARPDLHVTLSIPGGEKLAESTMNGRLGIRGGLSVLGTTGVVIPYSCAAWVHSIHRGVDVARAAGLTHLGAATGKTSEAVLSRLYDMPETALIDMGDFAGALLKYLRRHPVERLSLAGGFAKLVKLGQGALDLHSARSRVDMARLADWLREAGGSPALAAQAKTLPSAGAVLALAREQGVDLGSLVARRARESALAAIGGAMDVDVIAVDRAGTVVGQAGGGPDAGS